MAYYNGGRSGGNRRSGGYREAVDVYTDGSCLNNGRDGARAGIGVYWEENSRWNTSEPLEDGRQTNNSAEIRAACKAMEQARERGIRDLNLHTDSEFMHKSVNDWMPRWKENGWRTSSGEPVKNREDFERFDRLSQDVNVNMQHVRSHQGNRGNEAADRLANQGARSHRY